MSDDAPLERPIANQSLSGAELDELERRVEAEVEADAILTLRRLPLRGWEARTVTGEAGSGDSLREAIADLLPKLPPLPVAR